MPLEMLRAGELATVCDIDGNEQWVARLDEMGLRAGTEIRMIRPGSPCIVAFENHRLSLRGEECGSVMVQVLSR